MRGSIHRAQENGALPSFAEVEIVIEHPQNPEHGDYASNVALRLARSARMNPLKIASTLAPLIAEDRRISAVEAAPPGFLNFTLDSGWLAQQVGLILEQPNTYGSSQIGNGVRVQLEYVSANPTGPIHVGGGRGAILGSTMANLMSAAGYDVQREYYVNDAGSQMLAFYGTLSARYLEALGQPAEIPTDGYVGAYMIDLAKSIVDEHGDEFRKAANDYLENPPDARSVTGPESLGKIGLDRMLDSVKESLARIGVTFDNFFSEQTLTSSGDYDEAMSVLAEQGFLEDREGARWFVSTALGESKDNVVIRSNGAPTYFASDIAYHFNKFGKRKFDRVINIWGADHQGHVSRMKAVVKALGFDPSKLNILITQMVALKRGSDVIKISKRTGDIITLDEVVDEVGKDACRFNFLARSADSQMDFDLELAKAEAPENPVYYVQYAHARISSILRKSGDQGIDHTDGDLALLTDPAELALIRKMLLFPELIELTVAQLAPHHLPHYAQDLATSFHGFYNQCRVISDDAALTKARLRLVGAAQIVLARALHLMGMDAPDQM